MIRVEGWPPDGGIRKAVSPSRRLTSDATTHLGHQLVGAERLGEHRARCLDTTLGQLRTGIAGHQNDRQLGMSDREPPQQLHPVELRHHDVGDHHAEPIARPCTTSSACAPFSASITAKPCSAGPGGRSGGWSARRRPRARSRARAFRRCSLVIRCSGDAITLTRIRTRTSGWADSPCIDPSCFRDSVELLGVDASRFRSDSESGPGPRPRRSDEERMFIAADRRVWFVRPRHEVRRARGRHARHPRDDERPRKPRGQLPAGGMGGAGARLRGTARAAR